MSTQTIAPPPNKSLQPLEPFEKWRKEFADSKGFARCETETAGAVESTVPPAGVGMCAFAGSVVDSAWLSWGRWVTPCLCFLVAQYTLATIRHHTKTV